jgi:multidrug efflux pump subunit AcrA (membrane-fusion protein)
MASLNPLFIQLLATLDQERQTVLGELRQVAGRRSADVLALECIRRSLVELEAQAEALIVTMLERGAGISEVDQAQELAGFFQYVSAQVTSLVELAREQGQGSKTPGAPHPRHLHLVPDARGEPMSDDEMLQTLRAARDALQKSLRDAIQQADLDDPEALDRMLLAQQQLEEAEDRLAFEEAKRPPVQGPKDRRRPSPP